MREAVTRETIIDSLVMALKVQSFIRAVWLEGSAASGFADAYSDIDMWVDVDAGFEEAAFTAICEGLLSLGPLEHAVDHPHPQLEQRFYRLEGVSPYLFLDVCLQQHGRGTVLPPHEPFRVLYNPDGVVRVGTEAEDVRETVSSRLQALQESWWRRILVLKEVERGRVLEALGYYHALVLEPLTELYRLLYCPEKHDYGLKHLYRDVSAEVVEELEALYQTVTLSGLPGAVERANGLFENVCRDLLRGQG